MTAEAWSAARHVTAVRNGRVLKVWGYWNRDHRVLHWWVEQGDLVVEAPSSERGRTWAWGWDGAEARALKAALALEHT